MDCIDVSNTRNIKMAYMAMMVGPVVFQCGLQFPFIDIIRYSTQYERERQLTTNNNSDENDYVVKTEDLRGVKTKIKLQTKQIKIEK